MIAVFLIPFSGCRIHRDGFEDDCDVTVKREWADWIKKNYKKIGSISSEEFGDLEFLKSVIGEKKLVQLGESGHGVKEFSQMKIRLIKFLHQKMGFSVIAFESSIFSCWDTNEKIADLPPLTALKSSIFPVWHTKSLLELFKYIKETKKTDNPLILAGFDTQDSAPVSLTRPDSFKEMVAFIDPSYAEEVYNMDYNMLTYPNGISDYAKWHLDEAENFYQELLGFLKENREELIKEFGKTRFLITRQKVWSIPIFLRQLIAEGSDRTLIRDRGMADNLTSLINEIYPGKKIIVWAHNFHISHAKNSQGDNLQMGSWIVERFRKILYTIGLYIYQGKAATNTREIYDITGTCSNSLEEILIQPDEEYLFVDMLNQTRVDGNSWMFEEIWAKSWEAYYSLIVPRNSYDGLIYIKNVNPPDYN